MADEITSCVKYLNQDGSVRLYVFQFSFDSVSYPEKWGEIIIFPDELQDRNNMNELRALAISRASSVKAMCGTAESIVDFEGPVEL